MIDPKDETILPSAEVEDASGPLETASGDEGADAIGAEHDGPTKPLDADGGAYIVP